LRDEVLYVALSKFCSMELQMEMEIINDKIQFETNPWRCYTMPDIKTIWVLTRMTLQIVYKPLTLAMKIMVLIVPTNLDGVFVQTMYIEAWKTRVSVSGESYSKRGGKGKGNGKK
jgi:hypothetical protein